MKICILGFGHVGSQLARLWSVAGHSVVVALRTGSKRIEAATEAGVAVMEPHLAARSSEVIVLAVPWQAVEEALNSIGSAHGAVLIDATNPLDDDLSVVATEAGSGAQQIAAWSREARVVKAFNTIGADCMGNSAFDMYYCGDDSGATNIVHRLIEDVKMRPVNVGPLKNAGYLEHMAGLWISLAVSGQIQGAFGFNLARENGR